MPPSPRTPHARRSSRRQPVPRPTPIAEDERGTHLLFGRGAALRRQRLEGWPVEVGYRWDPPITHVRFNAFNADQEPFAASTSLSRTRRYAHAASVFGSAFT